MQSVCTLPRLVIAGTHSGVGKTSVVTAFLAALCSRGVPVRPFKVGPDYIDPAFHVHVTGVPSRNLDSWLLDEGTLRGLFVKNDIAGEGNFAIIEGVMGLFDGKGSGHEGSTAHVAQILNAPVVLVLDARGLSRSAAALVSGYADFHSQVPVAGVIVNRVRSERQYSLIRDAIVRSCVVPCLGYLPEDPALVLQSRHLGLIPNNEVPAFDSIVAALGQAALRHIDLDACLALARSAPPFGDAALPPVKVGEAVRLAVARDAAFSFYYQDNLDLLTAMGAELVFFSPMRDGVLPEGIHGLYLGGGFPEVFAETLTNNTSMRSSVRAALEGGLPCYAECGGMAYLCRSLTDTAEQEHDMVGFFPNRVVMTGKLQRFGYAEAEFLRDTIMGDAGTRVRTHNFHYSRLTDEGCGAGGYLRMHRDGMGSWSEGLARKNVLAAYPHVHFYSNPFLARNFLARCAAFGMDQ